MKKGIFSILCILFASAALGLAQSRAEIDTLKAQVEQNMTENILPFWMNCTVDPDGGFYGAVTNEGKNIPSAEKGAIMNARIVWTFSRALRQYGLESYRKIADRAASYFMDYFIDKKYGGVYWSLDSDGGIKDATKQSYATAFGIYGLSEHFRATGDRKSLDAAIGLYRVLEDKVHDKARKGYYETFMRDYTKSEADGVDGRAGATKTMNTHIHILEAYTNLYKVWPNEELKANLIELLGILQNQLYNSKGKYLVLFCDDDWKPYGDDESFGHDIETSWLMVEAAKTVDDEALIASVEKQAIDMVDVALSEGLSDKGYMRYERSADGKYSNNLSWWPQCETIIGSINAWEITGQKKYFDAAVKTWEYVKAHFVDYVHGGWFKGLTPEEKPTNEPKASQWNCPYHNSRLAFELISRLAHPSVHSEVMAWSNMTGIRVDGELVDFESTLRVGVPDGEIEATGREKQQHIQYRREGDSQLTTTPMKGAVISQTVTDVDISTVNISWTAEATEDREGSLYFCMSFPAGHYATAAIKASGKNVSVTAPDRKISMRFDKAVKMNVREEDGNKVLYVTLLPKLKKGASVTRSAVMKVDIKRSHEKAEVAIDPSKPGRIFAGFGGNFRIQNVQKDPEVIDYCLRNMRVAFGRVEFPWALWDQQGPEAEHIKQSAEMARRLKAIGMPVIVTAWFPPSWAGNQTTRSDGTSRAFSLKAEAKDRIFASITSYLEFLKTEYGVEADFFSFNESDLGINVVQTPEEHRTFIKEFGAYLASKGLKTLMLLGDNSDASTFDFILPALNDPDARRYIGAVSFHSWRGCDDETLAKWAGAARSINAPLIVAEGSTDAAAHQYPAVFNEPTFAFYEINLYVRLCALCQPLSILQWQLTSDYSLLLGDGIFNTTGPLHPTQRFFNLKQLSMTPENAFAAPATSSKSNITVAGFVKPSTGESAVHIVNNGASCEILVKGLPAGTKEAVIYTTTSVQKAEAQLLPVSDGSLSVMIPAESFITVLAK